MLSTVLKELFSFPELDDDKPMDPVTKERYLMQLNYKNRMKLEKELEEQKEFKMEEEKAFQKIPARPKPFEIKTENVNNNTEDHLQSDSYINILPSIETALYEKHKSSGYETSNSKGKILSKNKNELETVVSSEGHSNNILRSSNHIYDGDREENIEHNISKSLTLHNEPSIYDNNFTARGEEQPNFQIWRSKRIAPPNVYEIEEETGIEVLGVSICEQAQLTKTSKVGLIKSNNNKHRELSTVSKHITILPRIYERVVETGVTIRDVSICDQPETPNIKVTRSQFKSKHILVVIIAMGMVVMMAIAGLCYYFTLTNTDNTTATNDVPVTAECLKSKANCYTTRVEKMITENTIAREVLERTRAARIGNITKVCELLQCGASANSIGVSGNPLYLAAQNGHVDVTQLLLTYNASVDKASLGGWTSLHEAVFKRHEDIIQLLLTYNASVNKADSDGHTPLHIAAHTGHVNITKLLLSYNASVDKPTTLGITPMYVAAEKEHEGIIQLLLRYNASVNNADSDGITPLHVAAEKGHVNITQLLLSYNASVDKPTTFDITPMYVAAEKGHEGIIQLLLRYNASVNNADSDGWTSLHVAAQTGHVNITKLLLTYNASVDKPTTLGITPLHVAAEKGYVNITQLLLTYNASVDEPSTLGYTPLYVAAENGHVDIIKLLLTYNASVDKADTGGYTPLYIAAQNGHINITQLLITYNASLNKSAKEYGWTPLHIAVLKERRVIVELLCYAGAQINAQTHKLSKEIIKGYIYAVNIAAGSTALHIARKTRNKKIVKILRFHIHKRKLLRNKNI